MGINFWKTTTTILLCLFLIVIVFEGIRYGKVEEEYIRGWNDRIKSEWHYPNNCEERYILVVDCSNLKIQVTESLEIYNKTITNEMKRCAMGYTSECENLK